jgi:hypothetical protein
MPCGPSAGGICMRRFYFLLLSMFVVFPVTILANGARIVYKTDPAYLIAELGMIESGRCAPGSQHAVTGHEFALRFGGESGPAPEGFDGSFSGEVVPNVVVFDSPWEKFGDFYPTQMIYVYEKLPKLFSAKLSMSLNDNLYAKMTYDVSASKIGIKERGAYHPASTAYYAAGDSPSEGYISLSTTHASLTMGRFKGGIGHGLMGNTFQNSLAPYYDQIQFSFYSKSLKYYYMIGSSNSHLTPAELAVQSDNSYLNKSDPDPDDDTLKNDEWNTDYLKVFAFHLIEFAPTDWMTFSAGEMNLVGGKFPDFNMVNPFGVYHDTYDTRFHSYTFLFSGSIVPAKRHFIFFEFLSNEIKVDGERNQDPTALGYQLGYWYVLPVGGTAKHRIAIEATHIDGWTYSDITPYLMMYQRQARREVYYDIPLGYSYGGDCEQVSLAYTLISAAGARIEFRASRLDKGEIDFALDENGEPKYAKATSYKGRPTGTVEHWNTGELSAQIPLSERLDIRLYLHYSYIENFGHQDGRDEQLMVAALAAGWQF